MTTYQTTADPTAVMGRRIGAYIVDVVVALAIGIGIFAATASVDTISDIRNPCLDLSDLDDDNDFDMCTIEGPNGDEFFVFWNDGDARAVKTSDAYVLYAALLAYWLLVPILWQGLSGMTVGKAVFGIRTVNEDGQAPGIGRAFIRTLLWIVDGIGCCVPLVGPIVAFTSKGHRRVGDMAAKTFVVDKSAMGGGPVVVPGVTTPAVGATPGYTATGPTWGSTPPETPPTATMGGGAVSAPPVAGEPQWDAARNAYIQWDAAQQKWMQFDDATQQWRPID